MRKFAAAFIGSILLLVACAPEKVDGVIVGIYGGLTSASPVGYGTRQLHEQLEGSGYAPCITPADCEVTSAALNKKLLQQADKDTKIVLIGHSYGAVKILRFAAELCEKGYTVSYLAIIDAPYHPENPACVARVDNFVPKDGGFGVEYAGPPALHYNFRVIDTTHISVSAHASVKQRILSTIKSLKINTNQ